MRSGSPAHDDHGWPSQPRPYRDEASSGPVRYGPRQGGSDPHESRGGRPDVPFGPEISWPNGFRPLDQESREVLESGYGPQDQRYRVEDDGAASYGSGFAYQQPAMDDYGYGDPGYSDPSYDGPRNPYSGAVPPSTGPVIAGGWPAESPPRRPREVPGYHVPVSPEPPGPAPAFGYQRPEFPGRSSGPEPAYPVTGAQEALPDTGPQPAAGRGAAYPDEWYGHPRLDERAAGQAAAAPRATDPRLEGIRYDELRYDEPEAPGYDEPLDDESWYQALRRNDPADPARPQGGFDEPRRDVPPSHGQQQWPVAERGFGYAQEGPPPGGAPRAGFPPRDGGQPGPWMTPRGQAEDPRRPGLEDPAAGYLGAPAARVGVLTPPAATPFPDNGAQDFPEDGPLLAGPSAAEFLAPAGARPPAPVRPGHGLDGPEITSSWPALPSTDGQDSFDEFWNEDDGEGDREYSRLFEDQSGDTGARPGAKRGGTGRRRGRSSDKRLWAALGGVVVVTAAAITGIVKFEFPSHGGPSHALATPGKIGPYARTVNLEKETKVGQLGEQVIKMSGGKASGVVTAVYQSGNPAAGGNGQIVMLIEGHLANAQPAASISGFIQGYPGAKVVSAGPLGGQAACVQQGTGTNAVAMCAFFDNDSFGEVVSPTMNATALSNVMRTIRPSVEQVIKK